MADEHAAVFPKPGSYVARSVALSSLPMSNADAPSVAGWTAISWSPPGVCRTTVFRGSSAMVLFPSTVESMRFTLVLGTPAAPSGHLLLTCLTVRHPATARWRQNSGNRATTASAPRTTATPPAVAAAPGPHTAAAGPCHR